MFKLLCSFTKKKTGSVFPAFCHTTFHHALITCCNVSRAGYIAARDQSIMESGVTEGGKTLPGFFFMNKHNNLNTNTKPQAKNKNNF